MAKSNKDSDKQLPAVQNESTVGFITPAGENIGALLAANLGDDGLRFSDLKRAKNPSGGATSFQVATSEGEEEVKEITGCIVKHNFTRSYFADPDNVAEGAQPDCFSQDAEYGRGDPGGKCDDCAFSQFESALKGKGQACKKRHVLYVLQAGSLLPMIVTASPSSLKNVRGYLTALLSEGKFAHGVVTKFSLEKAKNDKGTAYAKLVLTNEGVIEGKEAEYITKYTHNFGEHLAKGANNSTSASATTEE